MTLDEALRDITQRITCVDWDGDENREPWKAPTGEAYIEFCSGGVRDSDAKEPCLCATKEIAVATWRLAVLDYEAKRPGVLYWRVKPELEAFKIRVAAINEDTVGADETEIRWYVYSRLIVSNKSVIRVVPKRRVA